ncbi:MAG: S9 family peptidase, partial [Bacteroidetes bacterium]|nr:S9 family peptidase [Bacteroidota bacterium]
MHPPRAFRTRYVVLWLLLALLGPALFAAPQASAQQAAPADSLPPLTLETIHASRTFQPDGFRGGRWADDGPVITFVEPAEDSDATHLVSYNLETDEQTRLIDGTTLQADDVDRLIQIEGYQYSQDGSKVLLYTDSERVWRYPTKGYYYVYDLETQDLTPIADRDDGFQMFAKFNPAGDHVAFVRERDLYLVNLETMEETALTTTGSEGGIINGTSDWVYEEEFGLRDGWAWSPDGEHIAFVQLDETETRSFQMADLRGHYPEITEFRYPKAGEQNSEIRVGVVPVESDDRTPRFFDTGTWNAGGDSLEYIPQLGWTPAIDGAHHVWLFRMNRDQNDLDVLYGDPATLKLTTVLEETSDTWIEVETGFSDLDVGQLTYLDDDQHFAWISERDGYRHLYLYENDGTLVRQLTDGAWDVTDFHGVDEASGTFYFSATKESPLERHLYRAALDGSGAVTRITDDAGWHRIDMSADRRYYIDTYSNVSTPPIITLHEADGTQLQMLEDNAALRDTVAAYDLPMTEFMQVPSADSTLLLNAWIIKPEDMNAGQEHPLLMYVYGGPGAQTVRNQWGGPRHLWHQYLAKEHGIVVVSVDNRGTGARGKAFKSAQYKR